MFQNIGEKIKTLAIICTIIGCLVSVAGAIACWCLKIVWAGFVVLIVGCLFSWVGTFVLYGFGELITQATIAAKGVRNIQRLVVYKNSDMSDDTTNEMIEEVQNEVINDYEDEKNGYVDEDEVVNKPKRDECPSCFCKISPEDTECPNCGYKLK